MSIFSFKKLAPLRQSSFLIGLMCCIWHFSPAAFAADPAGGALNLPPVTDSRDIERDAQDISDSVMSPFCPGRTLSSCPSPQARDLRAQISVWLKQGYSENGVRNQLLTIYGEDVRGTPKNEGFGLFGWTAPFIFVLLLLLGMIYSLTRLRSSVTEPAGNLHSPDLAKEAKVYKRIEQELKERARS